MVYVHTSEMQQHLLEKQTIYPPIYSSTFGGEFGKKMCEIPTVLCNENCSQNNELKVLQILRSNNLQGYFCVDNFDSCLLLSNEHEFGQKHGIIAVVGIQPLTASSTTGHLLISKSPNPSTDAFYVIQKRRSKDFDATELWMYS